MLDYILSLENFATNHFKLIFFGYFQRRDDPHTFLQASAVVSFICAYGDLITICVACKLENLN